MYLCTYHTRLSSSFRCRWYFFLLLTKTCQVHGKHIKYCILVLNDRAKSSNKKKLNWCKTRKKSFFIFVLTVRAFWVVRNTHFFSCHFCVTSATNELCLNWERMYIYLVRSKLTSSAGILLWYLSAFFFLSLDVSHKNEKVFSSLLLT